MYLEAGDAAKQNGRLAVFCAKLIQSFLSLPRNGDSNNCVVFVLKCKGNLCNVHNKSYCQNQSILIPGTFNMNAVHHTLKCR